VIANGEAAANPSGGSPVSGAAASPGGGSPALASPVSETGEVESATHSSAGQASPATPVAPSPGSASPIRFVTPPPSASTNVDAEYSGEPLRFRAVDDLVGDTSPPGQAARVLDDLELHLGSAEEPPSFAAAEQEACWWAAMLEEMAVVEENRTWELVDPPIGCRPIGLKWVYKVKRNERGEVVRHKARLVAKGFVQREGIDFEEVFAPVARMEFVSLLLALAASRSWKVHHLDVKSAFLNGELVEEVYVQQPPGFVIASEEHRVLRLRKALYGLRQVPRAWNIKLDASLASLGYTKCATEHALYTRRTKGGLVIVGVYVDDLIVTSTEQRDIDVFKEKMKLMFRMSDLGLLTYYLGIEVELGRDAITLRQSSYAGKLLERSGMGECRACQTPMEEEVKLSKDSTAPLVDATRPHGASSAGCAISRTHGRTSGSPWGT